LIGSYLRCNDFKSILEISATERIEGGLGQEQRANFVISTGAKRSGEIPSKIAAAPKQLASNRLR